MLYNLDRKEGGSEADLTTEISTLQKRIVVLADLDIVALRKSWQRAWGSGAPKGARKRFLMLGIAWKWQAEMFGGLSTELARRVSALQSPSGAGISTGDMVKTKAISAARPMPGTRILRDWKGERHEVHILENGYLWRGKIHGSLSAVAKAITGVSRNGPKFFGLRDDRGTGS